MRPAPEQGQLTTRPIADTARDTLDWLRSAKDPTRTGLTRAEERDLLDAWHTSWD